MNDCPTCDRLRREAEYISRYDYRDGRDAWKRLTDHQRTDHIFHVATAETGGTNIANSHNPLIIET